MGVKLIRQAAGRDDIEYMCEELGDYIKLAVDIDQEISGRELRSKIEIIVRALLATDNE